MSVVQASAVLSKIRSRGYWKVVIRPTRFQDRRIANLTDLFPIVEKKAVQLRGWDYPHIDHSRSPRQGSDWVGQEYERGHNIEVWRFHMSGLFIDFLSIAGDWRDQSKLWPAEPGWMWGREIHYLQTIYSLVEIFEFASRLALSPVGGGPIRVEIDLEHLEGRHLVEPDVRFKFSADYQTDAREWKHRWEGPETELIARPRELAVEAAQDLFASFGLMVERRVMMSLQEGIGR